MGETWQLVLDSFWPLLQGALVGTIPLTLVSFALGLVIALLVAIMRLSGSRVLAGLGRAYVSAIRGTPLLVQLFVIFYGLPQIGLTWASWPSAVVALSLNVGGYAAEIIRAAILSVPAGQWEAGYTVGMSRAKTLRRIILPQAARVSVPPLSNSFISLVKDTSLVAMILVPEAFRVAQEISAATNEYLIIYMEVAVIYWVICLVLSAAQGRLERRLERHVVRA